MFHVARDAILGERFSYDIVVCANIWKIKNKDSCNIFVFLEKEK